MNGQDPQWLNDPDDQCLMCDDCPNPNGCVRECMIENYKHEDVAKIRGEDIHVR